MLRVICKTWTGTLANSADPDQMLQNVISDQGLHHLLKVQYELIETVLSPLGLHCLLILFKGLNETVLRLLMTIFPAYTQRQSTHQCFQCFDFVFSGVHTVFALNIQTSFPAYIRHSNVTPPSQ